ncbi:MAG: tripartite tricarboxylate transporter substrate binding protein [Betaproteobacteria bacterium]|nr:tripartite tricarboxylate transporter substrate binding protein [Betaproteobacteria bacterium]
MQIWTRLFAAAALLCGAFGALAQGAYPERPVKVVVPYPPGGTADLLGRLVSQKLSEAWGKSVVVENRGGAGGNIATESVARADADGYTLLLCNAPVLAINPTLYGKVPFDPVRDFEPVAMIAEVPLFLVVNPSLPAKNFEEFLDHVKKAQGNINYASGSIGSTTHLAMELFKTLAKVQLTHIPYKGSGPAITAVVAGEVQIMFELMPSAMSFVKSGRMRALAVTSAKRSPVMPELPTVAEAGLPGYDVGSWFGLCAPGKTPRAIVEKASADVNAVLNTQDMRERILGLGAQPLPMTPDEFGRFIRAEITKWSKVVKDSGAIAK